MNVAAKPVDIESANGAVIRKRVLVTTKDFKAGDVIYTVYSDLQLSTPLAHHMNMPTGRARRHCTRCRP